MNFAPVTLFFQVQEDLENGVAGAVRIPSSDAGKEEVIAALVTNVEAMIKADRKITALKALQVSVSVVKSFNTRSLQVVIVFTFCYAGTYMANGV